MGEVAFHLCLLPQEDGVNIYLSSKIETTSRAVAAGMRVNRLFIYACFLMYFLIFISI